MADQEIEVRRLRTQAQKRADLHQAAIQWSKCHVVDGVRLSDMNREELLYLLFNQHTARGAK